ncbi:unnamed protein product [Mytilus coruscus]|uniref:Uncharacterized protein n=1 Tax=Mytilus coruscus TaxID=42192 RepID=A0A6J8EBT2_MYTCO|nr:unnamed protein product [Mytilus coruscus]
MSTKLKTKFDINCAILAKDYLNGFPLRKSLGLYFNKFQAVILSLTKENHGHYDFYIEDDMPVIAVELDYVNEIRLNLRKCQYINCTTCEHLWFPRLIDIVKTKLPETTAVYHGFELRKGFHKLRLILCGSLTDEAWILNLLYQMTNFTEPYRIATWNKSVGTLFPFITNAVLVLNSPSLQKCKQINEHYFDKTITLYCITIAPAKRPHFNRFVDCYIDAKSMHYKDLADEIFSLAENDCVNELESYEPPNTSVIKDRYLRSEDSVDNAWPPECFKKSNIPSALYSDLKPERETKKNRSQMVKTVMQEDLIRWKRKSSKQN